MELLLYEEYLIVPDSVVPRSVQRFSAIFITYYH